ncbi:T9SS type A sorting domain-containing protein [Flavobacterium ponti]|uniref:T9SS type A sorting domain-containing protein n=1 Tax=Flavobacterium ponti TaxID=665133 RepID=A0ABV9P308_9FLAO
MKKQLLFITLFLTFYVINAQNCTTAITTPFSDDFQSSGSFSTCWVIENSDGISPVWTINSSTDIDLDGTIDNFATVFPTNIYQPAKNDWLFSPIISFTAGTSYSINVRYNSYNIGNVTANQSFSLYLVDDASSTANVQILLGDYHNITQNGVYQASNGTDLKTAALSTGNTFVPTTSGDYRIAIHANKSGNAAPLFIFDIDVTSAVASSEIFNSDLFTYLYNKSSNSLEINTKASNINTIEIYNLIGQKIKDETINNNNCSLNISSLENGVYITKVLIDEKIRTFKFLKN